MAIVLAETSSTVNITAPAKLISITFTLPRNERKPTTKACSDSVLVCAVPLRNISSMVFAIGADFAGSSMRT